MLFYWTKSKYYAQITNGHVALCEFKIVENCVIISPKAWFS